MTFEGSNKRTEGQQNVQQQQQLSVTVAIEPEHTPLRSNGM